MVENEVIKTVRSIRRPGARDAHRELPCRGYELNIVNSRSFFMEQLGVQQRLIKSIIRSSRPGGGRRGSGWRVGERVARRLGLHLGRRLAPRGRRNRKTQTYK